MQPSFSCCGVTEDQGWKVWEKVSHTFFENFPQKGGGESQSLGKDRIIYWEIFFKKLGFGGRPVKVWEKVGDTFLGETVTEIWKRVVQFI